MEESKHYTTSYNSDSKANIFGLEVQRWVARWCLIFDVSFSEASQYNADRMQQHSRFLLAKNQRRQQLQNERHSLYHLPAVQLKSMHEQKKIPTEWQDDHIL